MATFLMLLGFAWVAILAVLRMASDHDKIMKDFKEEK